MTMNFQNQLRDRIKKLQQLDELLSDPTIAPDLKELLSRNGAVKTSVPEPGTVPPRRKRKYKARKRGDLVRTATAIVKNNPGWLTARDVTERMEKQGFTFTAKNKVLSVSKALMRMAEDGEIKSQKSGEGEKSAHIYAPKD